MNYETEKNTAAIANIVWRQVSKEGRKGAFSKVKLHSFLRIDFHYTNLVFCYEGLALFL